MFDATKRKFRDVRFEQLNTDDQRNNSLAKKYNVRGIPKIVMLDAQGNVLYNGGAPSAPGQFESLVRKYHD